MIRILSALLALFAFTLPFAAKADPADIDAAARGVVRVVIVANDGERTYPISHGTGFAVTPTQIVTNAHVVREAVQDDTLQIGIVPSEGEKAAYARIVAVSPRNDLALVEVTGGLRLPPLTLAANGNRESGQVTSVGYPMNVDRAQGLEIEDIVSSQPPVKSPGFISGARPSRQFDTILHTAPIARGNSGGPLLDGCGRVLGVNSFGADSGNADAEFFFAVSMRELIPFLRANKVAARINELPCRSLAELDAAERARMNAEQEEARNAMASRAQAQRDKRERAQLEAELEVQDARDNAMLLTLLLLLLGAGAGAVAWQGWKQKKSGNDLSDASYDSLSHAEDADLADGAVDATAEADQRMGERKLMIGGTVALVAVLAAGALWFTRPGIDAIDRRVAAAMADSDEAAETPDQRAAAGGTLTCTLDISRSRITGAPEQTVEFDWREDGCVNARTQYGVTSGNWSRVFVPNSEDAVSINIYNPDTRIFRTDRYLLSRSAMAAARRARSDYRPPACGSDNAAAKLGDLQGAVTAQLPSAPNERLVYSCDIKDALSGSTD